MSALLRPCLCSGEPQGTVSTPQLVSTPALTLMGKSAASWVKTQSIISAPPMTGPSRGWREFKCPLRRMHSGKSLAGLLRLKGGQVWLRVHRVSRAWEAEWPEESAGPQGAPASRKEPHPSCEGGGHPPYRSFGGEGPSPAGSSPTLNSDVQVLRFHGHWNYWTGLRSRHSSCSGELV